MRMLLCMTALFNHIPSVHTQPAELPMGASKLRLLNQSTHSSCIFHVIVSMAPASDHFRLVQTDDRVAGAWSIGIKELPAEDNPTPPFAKRSVVPARMILAAVVTVMNQPFGAMPWTTGPVPIVQHQVGR